MGGLLFGALVSVVNGSSVTVLVPVSLVLGVGWSWAALAVGAGALTTRKRLGGVLGAWVRKVAGPGGWRACAARAGATTRVSVLAVQLGGAAGRVLRGLTGALAARSGRGGSHPLGMRASPPLR